MEANLLEDLSTYFELGENDSILLMLIKRAIAIIRARRNYPDTWSEDSINSDIEKNYYYTAFDAVVYAYSKQGAEWQQSHTENGISRAWIEEAQLYSDVVPFIKVL